MRERKHDPEGGLTVLDVARSGHLAGRAMVDVMARKPIGPTLVLAADRGVVSSIGSGEGR